MIKSRETLINEKTDIVSLLLSVGNINGFCLGAEDGNVTTTNIKDQCQAVSFFILLLLKHVSTVEMNCY